MKSLMLLWKEILDESGIWCRTSTIRDSKTASTRFEHEGLSFLTISLANFGKDFERSLDQGFVTHDQFTGFRFAGGLPRFLGGFLELVFDRTSGTLLDNASIDAIRCVRQLTLMNSKVQIPCSDTREKKAFETYIKCENDLKGIDWEGIADHVDQFTSVSRILFGQLFSDWDLAVYRNDLVPKHGPGATADRIRGNGKWQQQKWHRRLEEVFPMVEHLLPTYGYYRDLSRVEIVEPEAEQPVRVISVPKTLKTPRIIAIEPVCMQYMQQALLAKFLELHSNDELLYQLIGFDDQTPNRVLASQASLTGDLATLDLSEASDRVSNVLVEKLFAFHPHLAEGVAASRSTRAEVPHHGVIHLEKFASMGSALCFPVEAMVFLTTVFMGICRDLNVPLTRKLAQSYVGKVRIFGDDIIVPKEHVPSVIDCLETLGFKVNHNKSFWNGKFRESCGGDYYAGRPVTVVKVRRVLPHRRQQTEEIISTVSLRNQLYEAGYRNTCEWIDRSVVSEVLSHFPIVSANSSVLGRHCDGGLVYEKHHPTLHHGLVRGYVVRAPIPVSKLDGKDALLKFFLSRKGFPLEEGHLNNAGRPIAVDIKLRWAKP